MINLFKCPADATLAANTDQTCMGVYGQPAAIALQLRQSTPPFTSTTIAQSTTWNTLLTSSTATKVVIIPIVGFQETPGDFITEGGNDNSTFQGIPKMKGVGFGTATFTIEGATPAYIKNILAYCQHSRIVGGRTNLTAFLLTTDNYVRSKDDFSGIPIYGFMIKDLEKGANFKEEDRYAGQFYFEPHYSPETAYTKYSGDLLALKNA